MNDKQKEIEHYEWYIATTNRDLKGPYASVYSVETRKFKRMQIKELRLKIKNLKKEIRTQAVA